MGTLSQNKTRTEPECVYVWNYVWKYVWKYVRKYVWKYVWKYVRKYVWKYLWKYLWKYKREEQKEEKYTRLQVFTARKTMLCMVDKDIIGSLGLDEYGSACQMGCQKQKKEGR